MTKNAGLVYGSVLFDRLRKPLSGFVTIVTLRPYSVNDTEKASIDKLHGYYTKRWLGQVNSDELSIFDVKSTTNNGAGSYHAKLQRRIQTSQPQIWSFLSILNEIIKDTNLDFERLCSVKEISRPRKLMNEERRLAYKDEFQNGNYTPLQFLEAINETIVKIAVNL